MMFTCGGAARGVFIKVFADAFYEGPAACPGAAGSGFDGKHCSPVGLRIFT